MFMTSTNLDVLRTMVVSPDGQQLVAGGSVMRESQIPAVELWTLWNTGRPRSRLLLLEEKDDWGRGRSITHTCFVNNHLVALSRWENLFIINRHDQTWKRCNWFRRPRELGLWSSLWLGISTGFILGDLTCMAVSPDGRSVAVGCDDRSLHEPFDFVRGRPNYTIQVYTPEQKRWFSLTSGRGQLGALGWSPCGRRLAGIIGAQLVVWDVRSGEVVADRLRSAGTQLFSSPVFHPSGHFLVAAGANGRGRVVIWDTRWWRPLTEYEWPIGKVRQLAFSPDGTLGFAADNEGHILVWDVDLIEWP